MSSRKRPAAAPPPIGDVSEHADLVREIITAHPDWGYKRVGTKLGEDLGVTLEPKDFQAVMRVLKAERAEPAAPAPALQDFDGNVRDHVDAIKDLMGRNPGMGRRRIAQKLEQQLQRKLSEAHMHVIDRIMTEIAENRVAVGVKRPGREAYENFDGVVQEHEDTIKELMGRHPHMGWREIGGELEKALQAKLSGAHLAVMKRIMMSHGGKMSYEILSSAENAEVVQGLFVRDPEHAALRRALKDHFGRDVTPAVVSRLVSECCVRKRDGYPVRCVWQDRG